MDVEENMQQKFIIPEEIPANERTAFHGAAAAAAKAGKTSFSFAGKSHPVTMKKDLANKIADQKESSDEDEKEKEMDPEDKKEKLKKKTANVKSGETATMNPKMDSSKGEQKESVHENVKMHTSMATAHSQHGNAHESEVTNGGHDDHDHAGSAHHDAADAHKAAVEVHKKHGGDSSQYNAAAKKANSATVNAKDQASSAGSFKKVAKPKVSIGGPSPKKSPSTSPASKGVKAPGFTKMKMTNKGLQKESTIRQKLMAVLEGDRAKHYKGAAEAETMDDKYKGDGAKKMKKDHEGETVDKLPQAFDDASKAGRATKAAPKRKGDAVIGDKAVINAISKAYQGMK